MSEMSMAVTAEQVIPILEDIVIRLIPKDNIKLYTTQELSQTWKMPIEKIHLLRQMGALTGMKRGKDFAYTHQSVMQFLVDYADKDISNEAAIRLSVQEVKIAKKRK